MQKPISIIRNHAVLQLFLKTALTYPSVHILLHCIILKHIDLNILKKKTIYFF